LISSLMYLFKNGCMSSCKTGSDLIMEKSIDRVEPTKEEVEETLKK
jgi:hypothetical protein